MCVHDEGGLHLARFDHRVALFFFVDFDDMSIGDHTTSGKKPKPEAPPFRLDEYRCVARPFDFVLRRMAGIQARTQAARVRCVDRFRRRGNGCGDRCDNGCLAATHVPTEHESATTEQYNHTLNDNTERARTLALAFVRAHRSSDGLLREIRLVLLDINAARGALRGIRLPGGALRALHGVFFLPSNQLRGGVRRW